MLGFGVRFALLDVLSRVPAFRPSRTQWAASLATHQEQSLSLLGRSDPLSSASPPPRERAPSLGNCARGSEHDFLHLIFRWTTRLPLLGAGLFCNFDTTHIHQRLQGGTTLTGQQQPAHDPAVCEVLLPACRREQHGIVLSQTLALQIPVWPNVAECQWLHPLRYWLLLVFFCEVHTRVSLVALPDFLTWCCWWIGLFRRCWHFDTRTCGNAHLPRHGWSKILVNLPSVAATSYEWPRSHLPSVSRGSL